MDDVRHLMFIVIPALLLAAIGISFWFKKSKKTEQEQGIEKDMLSANVTNAPQKNPQSSSNQKPEELLILSVMAQPNDHFAAYDLLQAISAIGMQFGEMNIFHYYQQTSAEKQILFSLTSASPPGDFDLDRMGDFSCSGLILFLRLASVSHPQYAFDLMLSAAEQLADDLGGELRADPRTPWNEQTLQRYQEKIIRVQIAEPA